MTDRPSPAEVQLWSEAEETLWMVLVTIVPCAN